MSVLYDEETVISMWREMIGDMKRELGNYPSRSDRLNYERKWTTLKTPDEVSAYSGVLCYYVNATTDGMGMCSECPIFWGYKDLDYDKGCMSSKVFYTLPLDELINIPAKNIREKDELDSYDTDFFDI